MKIFNILVTIIFLSNSGFSQENSAPKISSDTKDSLRTQELDQFWNKLSNTVQEGDLEGYAAAYHEDAVVVFGSIKSITIKEALANWAQGFIDTKAGKATSNVEFRFSERIGDETTAYETGMFSFTLKDDTGKNVEYYDHLNALLVKKDGTWLCVMEYQKAATKEDWEALKQVNTYHE